MPDVRPQYTEEAVGANHPTKADVINRAYDVEHDVDGTHTDVTADSITVPNTGLKVKDSDASHNLIIKPGSNLLADRTLTITTGDASREIILGGGLNVVADCALNQSLRTSDSPEFAGLTIGSDKLSKIKYGTYTGDGSVSQPITGAGFTVLELTIVYLGADDTGAEIYYKTTAMGIYCVRLSQVATAECIVKDNRVPSLDADGFTVDDDGSDEHPNKNGATYIYIARGQS